MLYTLIFYNFILFSSTALLYISERERTEIGRKICLALAFLITVIPSAIRYEIGADYTNYVFLFEKLKAGSDVYMEPGFLFINYLIQAFGLSYEWLFAFVAIFIYSFAFLAYPKKNKYIAHLFFMLIFYFSTFNILRQMMAVVVVMYAVKQYMLQRSSIKYYVLIFFASFFHTVALLFFFIPWVNNKISRKILTYLSWGTVFFWILIFSAGASFVGVLIKLLSVIPIFDYSHYFESERYSNSTEVRTGLGVLMNIFFYFYPFLFIRKLISVDKKYSFVFALLLFYTLFWALQKHIFIFYRPKQAFEFVLILVVLMFLSNKFIPFRRSFVMLLCMFLFFSFNRNIVNSHTSYFETCNSGRLAPYVTIFNKEDSQRGDRMAEIFCYK